MKKPVKIIFTLLASAVLFGLVTVIVVPWAVDPNHFKAEIETRVRQNTGRVLHIDGDLELSLFPWLGLSTGKMRLSNAQGFGNEPFAVINHGQIKIKLWTLLSQHQLEISEIIIQQLQLNLIENPEGLTNWSDLLALMQNSPQTNNPLKLLEIANFRIDQAEINYQQQKTADIIQLSKLNLQINRLRFNQWLPIKLHFHFSQPTKQFNQTVDLDSQLRLNETADQIEFKSLKLNTYIDYSALSPHRLQFTILSGVKLDLKHHQFELPNLQFRQQQFQLSAQLKGLLFAPFNIRAHIHLFNFDFAHWLYAQFAIQLPKMADENALKWLNTDFQLLANQDQAQIQALNMQLDETSIQGKIQLTHWQSPELRFELALDKLNIDRYLPPTSEENQPQAKVNNSEPLYSMDKLKQLNVTGQIHIEDFKIHNLTMQGIQFNVNAKQGLLRSQQMINKLYQGAYNSKWILDVNQQPPIFYANEQLSHVQLAYLLKAIDTQLSVQGLLNLSAKLETRGQTLAAMKTSVNGKLNFLIQNALIRGFNLQKLFGHGKIILGNNLLIEQQNLAENNLFSSISGNALLINSTMINNDLFAVAKKVKLNGSGLIDFILQRIDYRIVALLTPDSSDKKLGIKSSPIFINVGGALHSPTYQVDLMAMGLGG